MGSDGYSVHIDGLGYFSLSLGCNSEAGSENKADVDVWVRGIKFVPEKELLEKFETANLQRVTDKSRHSEKMTDEEVMKRLQGYFAENEYMQRKDFEKLTGFNLSKSSRYIKLLVDCGYNGDKIPAMSAVIEYIHTATLLHDDIIDGAKYRRKRPTANSLYGNDIAVLCGDFLYSRSYITLTEYGAKDVQMILSSAALTMSEGEVIQLLKTGDINITFDDYIQIITRKTAVLFSAACEIGGRLAQVDENKIKALKDFGYYLGLGFQMTDDILDYMGDPDKGKPASEHCTDPAMPAAATVSLVCWQSKITTKNRKEMILCNC